MLLLEQILVAGAGVDHRRHVDVVVGGEQRRGVLRLLEALGDGLPKPGHLDPLFVHSPAQAEASSADRRCLRSALDPSAGDGLPAREPAHPWPWQRPAHRPWSGGRPCRCRGSSTDRHDAPAPRGARRRRVRSAWSSAGACASSFGSGVSAGPRRVVGGIDRLLGFGGSRSRRCPSFPIRAITAPTSTVSPSWNSCSASVPAIGEGTSTDTLSVSRTQSARRRRPSRRVSSAMGERPFRDRLSQRGNLHVEPWVAYP